MAELVKENMPAAKPKAPQKKRRSVSLEKTKARSGWLFILPLLFGLIFIYGPILVNSINFSFSNLSRNPLTGQQVVENIGFGNYVTVLHPEAVDFVGEYLVDGLIQLALTLPPIIVFSLFIAVLLNQKMMGRAAFRAIYFIPVIIATGLMDTLAQSNLVAEMAYETGGSEMQAESVLGGIAAWQVQALFEIMAVGGFMSRFVVQIMEAIFDIINRSGVQILIFLAGLQAIPAEVYESCKMDGATSWETFWKITFPMISPMILVNAIYTIIDSFTAADNIVMNAIVEIGTNVNMTVATAMGWVYFIVMAVVVALVMFVMSLFVFYQRRD